MEAVLHNLESTVELLAVSQTDFVCEWDGETVDRAFQWAQYCEHLHTRFHTNPSVRAALESRVRETNQLLARAFSGYRCVSLADLAQCRHRLLVGLLKNPATPHPVIKSLLEKFGLAGDAEDAEGDQHVDLSALSACRSACKLLGDFTLNRKRDFGLSVGTQVHCMMLLERIQAIQSRPGNQEYATKLLDCFLEDSGEGQDSFLACIAAALLSAHTMSEDTASQAFLQDWLEGHDGLLHSMCQSLPPELCTKLSQQWHKFRLAYWDSLKKSASSLVYDVSNGLWMQPCDTAVSFATLTERFKSLWSSPLKDETVEQLVALKQADGDFKVEGLSVWTDLLVQLK
ncbi:Fanconi anemia group F protein [Pangasianodon hypophthalmus]|uniref:Fanconi anemia group F protein n=1 Tax=Pangasianodon hypophthalmus TaxID=310915 RepID=UPI002307E9D2|nr:Fanconi anemia group F protein [Pangasianodon hypophthalmus]